MGVKAKWGGRRVKCPKCGDGCQVPAPASGEPFDHVESKGLSRAGDASQHASAASRQSLDALSALDAPASAAPVRLAKAAAVVAAPPAAAATSPPPSAGGRHCPKCGKAIGANAVLCIHCGMHLKSGLSANTVMRSRKAGKVGVALLASAGGALLGGGTWATIGIVTGYEVGYVAWLVGILAGLGVTLTTDRRGVGLGLAAASLALAGLFIGKFAWAYHAVSGALDGNVAVSTIVMGHKAQTGGFPPRIQNAITAAGGVAEDIDDDLYEEAWTIAVAEGKTLTTEQARDLLVQDIAANEDLMIQLVADDMAQQRVFPAAIQGEIDASGGMVIFGNQVIGLSQNSSTQAIQLARDRYQGMDEAARRTLARSSADADMDMAIGNAMSSTLAILIGSVIVAVVSFVGVFQIIFLILAVATAFKMGYGGGKV